MNTANANASTLNQFDFNAFNALMAPNGRPVAPGLKLAIAEGLIKDALWSLERYNNPMADDLHGIGNELKTFRIKYKEAAAARNAARAEISAPAVDQRPVTDALPAGTALDKDGNVIS